MTSRMGGKVKVSVTLSADLLERIDAEVEAGGGASRSSVIEHWLRRARHGAAATALREETVGYYESLDDADRVEDEAISRATSRKARRVRYD